MDETEKPLALRNVSIQVTENGFLLGPTGQFFEPAWVFETFDGMVSWLGQNLKRGEE